jgi:hypothetical protein
MSLMTRLPSLLVVALALTVQGEARNKAPNIVFCLADDMGFNVRSGRVADAASRFTTQMRLAGIGLHEFNSWPHYTQH